jgi:release factor glutamine methyltransferase
MEAPRPTEFDGAAQRLREALRSGALSLAQAGIPSARLDAEILLAHALGWKREQLMGAPNAPLTGAQRDNYSDLLRRRLEREPVAYILGRQEFWSLDFQVAADALIPRPETERLVEMALETAAKFSPARSLRILDIGTGSGAIAVSLAKELPAARIVATDVSDRALAIARANARRHRVEDRMQFLRGDLWAALNGAAEMFDLIVSNPPYLRSGEIDGLEPEVSRWEPRGALDGGLDGMEFYRRIAARAHGYLAPGGALALEIGADMGGEVTKLFAGAGAYEEVKTFSDYAGKDRVVAARVKAAGFTDRRCH